MERARQQAARVGGEIKLGRSVLELSLADVARRAQVGRSTVARVEGGDTGVGLDTLCAVGTAVGLDIVVRAYPGRPPSLRDTGQLEVAEFICAQANSRWRPALEVRAGDNNESADLVFFGPDEIVHTEIERLALDFQSQYRAAARKREFLADQHARPVRLVVAVEDTRRNRAAVMRHEKLIRSELPAESRAILGALRAGSPLGRDGCFGYGVAV